MTIAGLVVQMVLSLFDGTAFDFWLTIVALIGAAVSLRLLGQSSLEPGIARRHELLRKLAYWQLIASPPWWPFVSTSSGLKWWLHVSAAFGCIVAAGAWVRRNSSTASTKWSIENAELYATTLMAAAVVADVCFSWNIEAFHTPKGPLLIISTPLVVAALVIALRGICAIRTGYAFTGLARRITVYFLTLIIGALVADRLNPTYGEIGAHPLGWNVVTQGLLIFVLSESWGALITSLRSKLE